MRVYLADGSFESLLTAMDQALTEGGEATVSAARDWAPALLDEGVATPGEPAAAERLLERIEREAGPAVVRTLLHLYHSEMSGIERLAFEYTALALRWGRVVDGYQANAVVRRAQAVARKVGGEIHRMKGLLRFCRLASGVFWAPMEPDHNIVLAVALHFRRRLSLERWVVHDRRRQLAARWARGRLDLCDPDDTTRLLAELRPENLADEERQYQELWRTFYRAVAIPERRNPRVQAQYMPRRYWKYLTEKSAGE